MKIINYLLYGFGFNHLHDFTKSTFGFVYSSFLIIKWDLILSFIISTIPVLLGFNHAFFYAFCMLGILEYWTGIRASFRRNEKHESKKLGRMLLKMATYAVLLHILNLLNKNTEFPEVGGFEFNPFNWLYWSVLIAIIWQLLVSVLENLATLNYQFAGVLLKIINKKFYKHFELDDNEKDTINND